jgi:hypothetical protein
LSLSGILAPGPSHSQQCRIILAISTNFELSQLRCNCIRRWNSRAVESLVPPGRKRGGKGRGRSAASTRMVTIKADGDPIFFFCVAIVGSMIIALILIGVNQMGTGLVLQLSASVFGPVPPEYVTPC